MGFIKKIWQARVSEYPTRRTLTKEDGTTELVTVARNEGQISKEGDAFSPDNMNDLEERIGAAFEETNNSLTSYYLLDYKNAIAPFSTNATTSTEYTAPCDCVLFASLNTSATAGSITLKINDVMVANFRDNGASSSTVGSDISNIPMSKGDVVKIGGNSSAYLTTATKFVPYKRA